MPRIESMFAFIAEDQGPDDEGVIAFPWGNVEMPMVGADMARVNSLKPIAAAIAKTTGKKIKVIHFTQREDLEIIEPR